MRNILLALAMTSLVSCSPVGEQSVDTQPVTKKEVSRVIYEDIGGHVCIYTIDSCEYIVATHPYHSGAGITHKANCKNCKSK